MILIFLSSFFGRMIYLFLEKFHYLIIAFLSLSPCLVFVIIIVIFFQIHILAMASSTPTSPSNDLLSSSASDLADITASNNSVKPTDDLDSIPMNLLPAGNCKRFFHSRRRYRSIDSLAKEKKKLIS